ncbi:O-antigen translocase [Saccharicrinis fermentans]|uniref:O-antigen translocase n=1 Tax=Saccharicrinis fermentans DSM 9555 = JCM 21142 TaxID=869213 RepID=W7Y6Y4_9BACT|nr:O-antigen translocase [Saccharicrinis fermentans]GAF03418.1 hypothetical protein JCM21142_52093 [Saccharicrinis fermentans DSM 9555 = JCM 21142]
MDFRFYRHFSKIKDSKLLRISARNSIQVVIQFIIGILKIKITSIWLGPTGMALLSQFMNFVQIASNISGAGITGGTTKMLAAYSYSPKRIRYTITTSTTITIVFSFITSLCIFVLAPHLSQSLMHSQDYTTTFRIAGFFLFFQALTNLSLAILKGKKNYNTFIKYNIFIVISSVAILFPFTVAWGIKGAIWAFLLSFLFSGVFFIKLLKPTWSSFIFFKPIAKRFFGFSLMLFIPITISPVIQIIIRDTIIQHCSITQAGWWDGINRISLTYTSIIFSSLSLYYQPRITELVSFSKIKKEVYDTIKIIMPIVLVGSTSIFLARKLIIPLLFSAEFYEMHNLFLFQCIGDVLKVISWLFATVLVMKENIKYYILCELFMALFRPSIALALIPKYGINSTTLCYLISNITYLIIIYLAFKYHGKKEHIK